jgi:hypothetical protein
MLDTCQFQRSNAARGSAAILLMLSRNYGNFVVVNVSTFKNITIFHINDMV